MAASCIQGELPSHSLRHDKNETSGLEKWSSETKQPHGVVFTLFGHVRTSQSTKVTLEQKHILYRVRWSFSDADHQL